MAQTGNKHLIIVTSISPQPQAEERQAVALKSWKSAGFHGVSLNLPKEVETIRQRYGQFVEVVGVDQACRGRNKRPLVAVADLIETSFERNEGKFSLVLNADILLAENAGTTFSQEPRGVMMIPRWQIDRYESGGEMEKMERDPWGYDGVLLGSELRGVFLNRYFGLGLPWWDYWIPFRALHLGHRVQVLQEPLAFHVRHQELWDEKDRARLAGEMWKEVGVPPWKRLFRKHFGLKRERKIYGYHNHLTGHIREAIQAVDCG
jgi:hypothetical protein